MEISIFAVLGPVMIESSFSHTAGAARLARLAARIAARPFGRVAFGLSGSFGKTARGHGTDKALLAGALGAAADDEAIRGAGVLPVSGALPGAFTLISADLALAGQNAIIPADEAVDAMKKVDHSLPAALRETAQGGVAATPTARRLQTEFKLGEI